MDKFNLMKFADEISANFIFICSRCQRQASYKEALSGCGLCSHKLFKISRYIPLIENPLDAYRTQKSYGLDTDNGEQLNRAGDQGSIGESGFGQYGLSEIHDGAEGEERGMPDGNNDALIPDDSPIKNTNKNEPQTGGPHGNGLIPSGKVLETLFDRIRKERKYR